MKRLLALLLVLGVPAEAYAQNGANGHLQIHYINVGQGDAELIVSPQGQTVLIDSGPSSASACASSTGIITYLNRIGFTRLDVHIASHYDADHIGCTDEIVGRWPPTTAVLDRGTANPPSTQTYTRYVAAVAPARLTAFAGQTLTLDSGTASPVTIQIVALNGAGATGSLAENDRSIVAVLHFGSFDAEFGGDLPGVTASGNHDIESLVASAVGQVEVYKVHHHGSASASNATWLANIRPMIAMVSASATNSFGHPTQATMDRIHGAVTKAYWTTAGKGATPAGQDVIGGSSVIDVPPGGAAFTVANDAGQASYTSWGVTSTSAPLLSIDSPVTGSALGQSFTISGWTVDRGALAGVGMDEVQIYAYPLTDGEPGAGVFLGAASVSSPRGDVAGAFGSQFLNCGWSLSTSLGAGPYRLVANAHSTVAAAFNVSQTIEVTIGGPVSIPRMSLDGPQEGAVIQQPFITGGWAVDLGAPSGVGVDAIHVWAFPVVEGAIGPGQFVDAALLGGARPDVAAVFGPQFALGGFNFLMTSLAPGQYYVGVYVRSTVSGTFNQQQFALVTIR